MTDEILTLKATIKQTSNKITFLLSSPDIVKLFFIQGVVAGSDVVVGFHVGVSQKRR